GVSGASWVVSKVLCGATVTARPCDMAVATLRSTAYTCSGTSTSVLSGPTSFACPRCWAGTSASAEVNCFSSSSPACSGGSTVCCSAVVAIAASQPAELVGNSGYQK